MKSNVKLIYKVVNSKSLSSATTATASVAHTVDEDYNNAKPFSDIPGPPGLPYFGTLFQYKRDSSRVERYHDVILDRYRKYGKIYKETIAGETQVHLLDPDYIQTVYKNETKIPYIVPLMETTQMYRRLRKMSPGLGNSNGDEWYRLRSAVHRLLLDLHSVSNFLTLVNQVTDDFVRRIDVLRRTHSNGRVEALYNEISRWNLESSAMTCFETRLGCIEADDESWQQQMINANSQIFQFSTKLRFAIPWFKLFPTPTWKRLIESEDFFFGKGQKLVDETCEKIWKLQEEKKMKDDEYRLLAALLSRFSRKELSFEDVSIVTLSLFADGLSTTTPTLLGQLYCLAKNPDKQEKLYQEIAAIAPDRSSPITNSMIQQTTYLKACIKEGFRFFPVGTDVSRVPQKNMVIGGYQIPAGTKLSLNNNMLLRDAQYFVDPNQYRPERWVRGESIQNVHPYLLLPFGFGPRTCAGMRLAEQEMRIVIMKLLQNFRLEWPNDEPEVRQTYSMLLKPDRPVPIRFLPRT